MNFGFECFRKVFCCFPKIYAWGSNFAGGQASPLGNDNPSTYSDRENDRVEFPLLGTEQPTIEEQSDWIKVSASDRGGCGILADGSMWGWGGAPGNGTPASAHPVRVGEGNKWKDVSVSGTHTLAIRDDGTLWAWGINADNALGHHLGSPPFFDDSKELIRAVMSRPIASADVVRKGKYTEKPSARVVSLQRTSSNSYSAGYLWSESPDGSGCEAEAVMDFTIKSVEVTAQGDGYTSAPSVTLEEDGAAVGVTEANLAVSRVRLSSQGSGYKSPPNVVFSGECDIPASAEVTSMSCAIDRAVIVSGGVGYSSVSAVYVLSSEGEREINGASATVSGGAVVSVSVPSSARLFGLMPGRYSLRFASATGSGSNAYVDVVGDSVESVAVLSGGVGYKEPPQVSFVALSGQGSGASASASVVSVDRVGKGNAVLIPKMSYGVTKIQVTNGGAGYTSRPSVSIYGWLSEGGSPASATVSKMGSIIESVSVNAVGSGYSPATGVTVNGIESPSLAVVVENGGIVAVRTIGVTLVDSETAEIGFIGGGNGATATATLRFNHVLEVEVDDEGSGYSNRPNVSFAGAGSGAEALASVGNGKVVGIEVTPVFGSTSANGYRQKPVIVISGGGGSDAAATAVVEGIVDSISIKSPGSGYTQARFSRDSSLLKRAAVVRFDRAEGDELSDSSPQPVLGAINDAGLLNVGVNAAIGVCSISPGPVSSLSINQSENKAVFPKQCHGRVSEGLNAGSSLEGSRQVSLVLGDRIEPIPANGSGQIVLESSSDGWPSRPWLVETRTFLPPAGTLTVNAGTVQTIPVCASMEEAFPPGAEGPNKSIVKLSVAGGGSLPFAFPPPWSDDVQVSYSASDAEMSVKAVDGVLYATQTKIGTAEIDEEMPITVTTTGTGLPVVRKKVLSAVSGYDGPPGPAPVYDLVFLSTSGDGAEGTVSSPDGFLESPDLASGGDGYAEEPLVSVDGQLGSFFRPRQVGDGTWKSVSAGPNYSLAIGADDFPYWWGLVPIPDTTPSGPPAVSTISIPRPSRVGKRPYVSASPSLGDYSPPVEGGRFYVAPPDLPGIAASVAGCDRLLKHSEIYAGSKSSDEQSGTYGGFDEYEQEDYGVPQYEGDYFVRMSGGCGYTTVPDVHFESHGDPVLAASAVLVGPDACKSVIAADSRAIAIGSDGVVWLLNAPASSHGAAPPQKNRRLLYRKDWQAIRAPLTASIAWNTIDRASVQWGKEDTPGGEYLSPLSAGYFYLKSGGSGYTKNARLLYSGQKLAWQIVKTERIFTRTNCGGRQQLTSQSIEVTVHDSGTVVLPDNVSNDISASPAHFFGLAHVDVWGGSVIGPSFLWPHIPYAVGAIRPEYLESVLPPVPPSTSQTEGLVTTDVTYTRNVFLTDYGTLSVFGDEGTGAEYELVPIKGHHHGTGLAKIGGDGVWDHVTAALVARDSEDKLFYDFCKTGNLSHFDVPGVPYPEGQQHAYIRNEGLSGVRDDQSFWLLGKSVEGPPVVKGDVELKIEEAGAGYTEPAILEFDKQPDGVATASSQINGSVVGVGITSKGSGYASPPDVSITGGSGSGAQCEAVIAGPVASVIITSGGSGYRTPPRVLFSQPGISATATTIISGGEVTGVVVSDGGRYRAAPSVAFEAVPDIEAIELTSQGSGYTSPPVVVVVGGSGSGGAATCSIDGMVNSISLTSGGGGYTSPPQVAFVGGGGSGASAIAGIDLETGLVSGVTILSPGSGYQSPPSVVFSGGGGSGAAATATIVGPVRDVTVTSRGAGYDRPPSIFFQGGGGSGAAAVAQTAAVGSGAEASCKLNGSVIYCKITDGGTGYQSQPSVSFSGGDNSSIELLDWQLSEGHITQEEYTESIKQYAASATARILGESTFSIVDGGENYAYKRTNAVSPVSILGDPNEVYSSTPMWEVWRSQPYHRDGNLVQSRYWVHCAEGRQDQTHRSPYGSANPYLPSGWSPGTLGPCRIATPSTNAVPGGEIVSLDRPSDLGEYTGAFFHATSRQAPLVSFWNTKTIRATTSLRVAAVARKPTEGQSASVIDTWPHSLSHLNSVIEDGDASALGHLRGSASIAGVSVNTAGFMKGGKVSAAYLDWVTGPGGSTIPYPWRYRFSSPPLLTVECDIGSGADVAMEVDDEGHGTVVVNGGGSGYGSLARLVPSGGRPLIEPASATAETLGGSVVSISVNDSGNGYTSPPQVIIHGGGGSGATARVVMSREINTDSIHRNVGSVVVTSGGSGYTSTPSVSFVETDADFSVYAAPFADTTGWMWRYRHGHEEPIGYKPRFVTLSDCVPEYVELLETSKSSRVLLSSMNYDVTASAHDGSSYSEVELFFDDGYVTEVSLDDSHSLLARHPANLKPLPDDANVVARGQCVSPTQVSVVRPKWSNEMHSNSSSSVTFGVRDTTQ